MEETDEYRLQVLDFNGCERYYLTRNMNQRVGVPGGRFRAVYEIYATAYNGVSVGVLRRKLRTHRVLHFSFGIKHGQEWNHVESRCKFSRSQK